MSQPSVQHATSACKDAHYEIKRLATPQNAQPSEQFYPRDKIKDFLTRSKVEEILRCHRTCLECRTHLEHLQVGMSQGTVDPVRQCLDRISPPSRNGQLIPDDEALSLFALMVVLQSPLLIIPFVYQPTWGLDTYDKERKGNVEDEIKRVQARYFNCLKHKKAEVLAGSFVHESPFRTPDDGFARKEIRVKNLSQSKGQSHLDVSRANFYKEVDNLVLLNESLRDDHIVQIVKPYGIGNKMNIIFPCARANLNQCLRDDSYNLAELNCIPIRNCLIWKQMHGIARALNRILAGVKTEDGKELLGYHFDLKPANILVYGKDPETYTFKITDFGLSWFKRPDGDSNTLPFMGDGRYMPPEAAPNRTSNRRHDIWSFGCILLEATVFVVKSYGGVKKLDDACRMNAPTVPQAYFERDPADGSAILRQKVVEYMDNDLLVFVHDSANFFEEDKTLIREIILLIKGGHIGLQIWIAISAFGNLIADVYTSCRVKQAIALHNIIPSSKFFAADSKSFGTPDVALLLHWVLSAIVIVSTPSTSDGYGFVVGLFTYGQLGIGCVVGLFYHTLHRRMSSEQNWKPLLHGRYPKMIAGLSLAIINFAILVVAAFASVAGDIPRWKWPLTLAAVFVISAVYWCISKAFRGAFGRMIGWHATVRAIRHEDDFTVIEHEHRRDGAKERFEWERGRKEDHRLVLWVEKLQRGFR